MHAYDLWLDRQLYEHDRRNAAAEYEAERQKEEAERLADKYRSAIIREWAAIAIEDGEENYDLNTQATWADHIDWFLLERGEESLPLDIPMPTWQECVAAIAIN